MTRAPIGIASTSYMTVRRFRDAIEFFDHCDSLGAAGIQIAFRPEQARAIRERCERKGMYFEAMAPLPKGDAAPFEAMTRAAKEAGALCIRCACLSGRRYETFKSMEGWRRFVAESKAAVKVAVDIAEKAKLPLAIENHKDWTQDEFVALMREYESEWFGACLDTGNNIALLDEQHEFVDALAKYAISTHIKDMALEESRDGFLLSEVPLGAGQLDLKRIIATIQKARPKTRLTLEMITRDPLVVPCLTPAYWATFPERRASQLAATLALARRNRAPLPRLTTLPAAARAEWEDNNVKSCLHWARVNVT